MSPQQIWKKVVEQLSSKQSGKAKGRIKNLLILLGLGIGLMLLSHLYSGGTKTKMVTTSSPTAQTQPQPKSKQAQQASLLKSQSNSPQTLDEYATYYEDQLTKMLDSMAGISNARVMVTLSTGPEKVYQQDVKSTNQNTIQHDSNGGTQTTKNQTKDQTTVMVNQNGQNGPLLITQKGPTFKAILVVANGVSHPAMKERVVNAVSTVLDVPSYKVSVQERN